MNSNWLIRVISDSEFVFQNSRKPYKPKSRNLGFLIKRLSGFENFEKVSGKEEIIK